jgi:rod shape determining protein RodA
MLAPAVDRPAPGNHRRTRSGPSWRHFDLLLVLAVVAIAAFGCLMVWTATRFTYHTSYVKKQALFVGIGLIGMLVVARIDYRRWRDVAPLLYGVSLLALVGVFVAGSRVSGAQAWYQLGPFQFEPSELASLALIIAIAAYAASFKGELTRRGLAITLAMAMVPFALCYLQPDLGTALIILAILLVMLVIGGVRMRHLGVLILIGSFGIAGAVGLGVLKPYQTARLTSFADTPNSVSQLDLQTYSARNIYNVVESKDAISNGGLLGQGIGKGVATNASVVPEQQTDFIFSAAGEQVGLVGCVLLLLGFLLVLWRTWQAATLSRDLFGTLLCVGVLGMLLFQIFENVGMTMGIMPVAGIPLPWMSYGGSAVLIEFLSIGLVLSVRMHRFG